MSWYPKLEKWSASARIDGRSRHIGYFTDEREAAEAAEAFRLKHMPFARPELV